MYKRTILTIAEKAAKLKSYRQAGEHALMGLIVSKQTIPNCLDKDAFVQKDKPKKDADCLYIDVDGYFANYK